MFNDFYAYRKEVRKKLGRSQLYPENSNHYKIGDNKYFSR